MGRVKLNLEYLLVASPTILYQFLTTPSCLVRWFCDNVDIQNDVYTFFWEGSFLIARLVDDIEEERIRFEWIDGEEGEYLEFLISQSPVTGETILEITDFCDDDEKSDYRQLWDNQIKQLRTETGG